MFDRIFFTVKNSNIFLATFNKKFYFMKRAETTQCLKWPQPSCHHFWLVVWVFVEVRTGSVQFFSMFLNQT